MLIDGVGYLPPEKNGANLFFQLVNARYETGAMILTSNHRHPKIGERGTFGFGVDNCA